MTKIKVAISERDDDGWDVVYYREDGAVDSADYAQTAAEALKSVKAHGTALAEAGKTNAIIITWNTISRVGKEVVSVLTNTEGR